MTNEVSFLLLLAFLSMHLKCKLESIDRSWFTMKGAVLSIYIMRTSSQTIRSGKKVE